jgi:hypothetical protein
MPNRKTNFFKSSRSRKRCQGFGAPASFGAWQGIFSLAYFFWYIVSRKNNWIPLDKNLINELPKTNRPYTKLEAMFSFTYDQDFNNKWSIKGYAKLWNWSRNKVRRFVNLIRTPHEPPKGHPKGHPIHFIDKGLWTIKDTPMNPPKDTQRTPTNNPLILNNNLFEHFWLLYPKKKNKGQAKKTWKKLNPNNELFEKIKSAIEEAKQSKDWLKEKGQFIPYPSTWLNAEGWEDEYEKEDGWE